MFTVDANTLTDLLSKCSKGRFGIDVAVKQSGEFVGTQIKFLKEALHTLDM